jgi:hypothetical protein
MYVITEVFNYLLRYSIFKEIYKTSKIPLLLNFIHKKLIGIHLNLFENNSIVTKFKVNKTGIRPVS